MFQLVGGWETEAYTKLSPAYLQMFWTFAYALIIAIDLVYYQLKKDKSETVALLLIPLTLIWFGLEDVIYYIMMGIPIMGAEMPWLYGSKCMGGLAKLLGLETVTGFSLLLSLGIGFLISYYLYKWLKRAKW